MERKTSTHHAPEEKGPLEVLWEAHALADGRDRDVPSEGAGPEPHEAAGGKRARSRRFWIGGLLILALIGAGLGYWYRFHPARSGGDHREAAQAVYYCPMHPEYTSDRPGECPICGMTLVKREEPQPDQAEAHPEAFPPGTVRIDPRKQQLIGIAVGEVTFGPVTHTIRTVGKVTYDETKIARVHAKIEGWIEKVHVDFVGKFVRKGQPLLEIYSPELVATQQELLLALRAKELLGRSSHRDVASGAASLYEASRKRLEFWDIPEEEIQRIQRRGEPLRTLTLYAPVSGYVLARNAFERQRVTPETELYTIADLSTVWVLVDIYEYEAPMVRLGQKATMTLPYFPGEVFHGRVVYIYPQLDNTTRTLKVRLEFPNPGLRLKPDMYADVQLQISYGQQLSVPEEAVLDSGTEQIVFVAHEGGYFEPRRVRVGPKVANRYIILSGLKPGERIVTSGNFLVDSESRLKSALTGMQGMGREPEGRQEPAPSTERAPRKQPSGHRH